MPDPAPRQSLLTRLVAWLLRWLTRRDAQAAADSAAITQDQEAAHAAHAAQADAPRTRSALADGVRDGADF